MKYLKWGRLRDIRMRWTQEMEDAAIATYNESISRRSRRGNLVLQRKMANAAIDAFDYNKHRQIFLLYIF